eukprot:scaffold8971_cov112-Cylindrotheca_fusiformis.AAC.2
MIGRNRRLACDFSESGELLRMVGSRKIVNVPAIVQQIRWIVMLGPFERSSCAGIPSLQKAWWLSFSST